MKLTLELDVEVVVKQISKSLRAVGPSYSHGGLPAEPAQHEVIAVLFNGKNIKDDLSPQTLEYIQQCVDEEPMPFG
jgi:hypothetical protein